MPVLQSLQQEDLEHLPAREVYASGGASDTREALLSTRRLRHDDRESAKKKKRKNCTFGSNRRTERRTFLFLVSFLPLTFV